MLRLAFRARVLAILAGGGAAGARERERESGTGNVELVAGEIAPDPFHFVFHGLGFRLVLHKFDGRKAVDTRKPDGRYRSSSGISSGRD